MRWMRFCNCCTNLKNTAPLKSEKNFTIHFVCLTPLQFEKTKLNFRLVLNPMLQIAGLFLEPMEDFLGQSF